MPAMIMNDSPHNRWTDPTAHQYATANPKEDDLADFYPALGHIDCLERLEQDFQPGSLALVTGQAGIGKSMLIQSFRVNAEPTSNVIVINYDHKLITDMQLLEKLLMASGASVSGRTILDRSSAFSQRVKLLGGAGIITTVVIDDAHRLTSSQLDILRTVLTDAGSSRFLRILLVGEESIRDRIDRKRSLAHLVDISHVLNPLNPSDSAALITHRYSTQKNNQEQEVFESGALDQLHRWSQGVPGLLLLAARAARNAALATGDTTVTSHHVESIIRSDELSNSVQAVVSGQMVVQPSDLTHIAESNVSERG
jgi:type II secretory pathway predicted ATPase ExeA